MTTRAVPRGVLILLVVALLALPAVAAYGGGDLAVSARGRVVGDVLLTHGDSRYSGEIGPGGTYTVTFTPALPPGAALANATVYLFYTWSHAGTAGVLPDLRVEAGGVPVSPARTYTDRKGKQPYDYPAGLLVYDVVGQVRAGSPLEFTVTNAAAEAGVAFPGAVLLVAHDGKGAGAEYWVAEGAEMLYATEDVSPWTATARVVFQGLPPVPGGGSATLLSVVPGGDKGKNVLTVNGREFPGLFNGKPYGDLAMAETDVGALLVAGENTVTLRDEGDYTVPGVFSLVVRGGDGTGTAAPTQGAPLSGIGALVAVSSAAVAALGRKRRAERGS